MKIRFELGEAGWRGGLTLIDIDVPFHVSAGRGNTIYVRNIERVKYIHHGPPKYLNRIGMVGTDEVFTDLKVSSSQEFPIYMIEDQQFTLDMIEIRMVVEFGRTMAPVPNATACGELRLIP
jgi:hypothetical protein